MSDLSNRAYDETRDFVVDQCIETDRQPLDDWKGCVRDAIAELDRIVYHQDMHPDAVMRARLAMNGLAGIWLTTEELDERYLAIEAATKGGPQ